MTEEKQCAGFNTGSESGLRSCVVGGPLSTERGTIAVTAATTSRRARGSIAPRFHGLVELAASLALMGTR